MPAMRNLYGEAELVELEDSNMTRCIIFYQKARCIGFQLLHLFPSFSLIAVTILQVIFDYPYEILTHVTGHYGPVMYMGPNVIKSLTFHTTKTKYGPFGEALGTPFSTNVREGGKVVGFHGRKGLFLDALGVHVVEGKVTPLSRPPCSDIVPAEPPSLGTESAHWSKKLAPSKGGSAEAVLSNSANHLGCEQREGVNICLV